MTGFIIGFVFCLVIAWYYHREQQKRIDRLYADFLLLVNEISVRSGGRAIFKDKKPLTIEPNGPPAERDEFRIMTPSMAEVEMMERDAASNGSNLDETDMEHLRRMGVIN